MGGRISRESGNYMKAPNSKYIRLSSKSSTSSIVSDNPSNIKEFYELEKKTIAEGSYGSMRKAKHKRTNEERAVRTTSKAKMENIEPFKREIQIMNKLDHPNIIKLYDTFEDSRNLYLIIELGVGGDLFDKVIEAGHFTELQAAILMQQITRALYYMHSVQVCHRDLKPESFLFMTKDPIEKNTLKIFDFNLSCRFEPGQVLTTKSTTAYYIAPQVLAGSYDYLSDMWSCGVIMYLMICGYPPFFGETDAEVLSKIQTGIYSFNPSCWKSVSEDAKNLIRLLLKMDPKQRYTAQQTLSHTWIRNRVPYPDIVRL